MYEIDQYTLDHLRYEIEDELDDRRYDYNGFALNKILNEWKEAKQNLLCLLSKHPNWNPEKFMIAFDEDYSRKRDTNTAFRFTDWVAVQMNDTAVATELYWYMRDALVNDSYLSEGWESKTEFINTLGDFHFRTGMKTTRVMRKLCEFMGLTDHPEFERKYAQYCDALNPIKVTRHTCISLNPLDYLLMSNGNSWGSCHDIRCQDDDPGCYSSGTISYMLDNHSIIFYTVDKDYDGDEIEREAKIQRQVFGYNDFQLLQSRLYPQNNDWGAEEIYTDIRNIVQKVVADCLEMPNLWVKSQVKNVFCGNGATCYPDWNYERGLCSLSTAKSKVGENLKAIVLGTTPICIECGCKHSKQESINCCRTSYEYYCAACGEGLDEDDVIWVGDYAYCRDCVYLCDECDEYTRDNLTYIPSVGRWVCEDCLDEYYRYCDICDAYHPIENTRYVESDNNTVCDNCFERYYVTCNGCGDYFYRDDAVEVDGLWFCDVCAPEEEEEEDESQQKAS